MKKSTILSAVIACLLASGIALAAAGVFTVSNSGTATVTDVQVLTHNSTGTPAAGFGTGLLFRGQDASKTAGGDDMGRVASLWDVATSSAENSYVRIATRTGGAALADVLAIGKGTGGGYTILYPLPLNQAMAIGSMSGSPGAGVGAGFTGFTSASSSGFMDLFAAGLQGLRVSGTSTTTYGSITIASAAGATWNAVNLGGGGATPVISGSTNITTATGFNEVTVAAPTLSCASALTVTNAATSYIAGAPTGGGAGPCTITNPYASWVDGGAARFDGRVMGAKGADVASATNIVLLNDGNLFSVTGTTQIDCIQTVGQTGIPDWTAGSQVTLYFNGTLNVRHNQACAGNNKAFLLAGAATFAATASDTLTVVYDGTTWREVARVVI